MTEGAAPDLVAYVAGFARLLRDAGVRTGPGRVADAVRALTVVGITREDDVRSALRAVLVARRDDLAVFDAAFDVYWMRAGRSALAGGAPARTRPLRLEPERARAWSALLGLPQSQMPRADDSTPESSGGYSDEETLRQRDFGSMTWAETEQVRRLLAQSPWRIAQRPSRRRRPASSGAVDLRRTVRRSVRSGGDAAVLERMRRRARRRRLVLLCDVSGSMERYARPLLLFAHAVARREDVEAFVFSTRLTRISRSLHGRDPDDVLGAVAALVHDAGGGTRIGQSLHEFNRTWARRVLAHGAVVLLISDGWDRGDPEQLGAEMARLQRSCHRLVWLNPLLGGRDYRPEARGMAAALPHCDDFLAAHNLDALDELGRRLAALDPRRPVRSG